MQSAEYTYREHRTRTVMQSLIPIFINTNTTRTPHYLHHASLYAFTEADASLQMKIGNTKNRVVNHYSSEIVIDTDNLETAEKVWETLCQNNIYFELYKLNNYKFYLQRSDDDEPSTEMCYQDGQYVKDLLGHCNINNGLDVSIYSYPFHVCRTKSSIHEITGKKTHLIEIHKGECVSTNNIEIKKYGKPLNFNSVSDINSSDWSQFQLIIEMCFKVRTNRHLTFWQLAKDLKKLCSFNTILDLGLVYARSLNYEESKAVRAIEQGYSHA
jgi:hypothetical protein